MAKATIFWADAGDWYYGEEPCEAGWYVGEPDGDSHGPYRTKDEAAVARDADDEGPIDHEYFRNANKEG